MNEQLTDTDYTDKRRKTVLVLDVETALSKGNEQLVFDIGYTISEMSNQRMVLHRSFLVQEIFLDMSLMERAYYFKKYPQYLVALSNGKTQLKPFNEIISILNEDMRKYNSNNMYAYNANFDSTAIMKTNRYLNPLAPELKYKMHCLWSLSTQTIMASQRFVLTAIENGWLTEKGNIRTSAEITYRYLTENHEFVEDHTGLEDSLIETKILWAINKNSNKKDTECVLPPWKRVKALKDEMGLES